MAHTHTRRHPCTNEHQPTNQREWTNMSMNISNTTCMAYSAFFNVFHLVPCKIIWIKFSTGLFFVLLILLLLLLYLRISPTYESSLIIIQAALRTVQYSAPIPFIMISLVYLLIRLPCCIALAALYFANWWFPCVQFFIDIDCTLQLQKWPKITDRHG